MQGVPFGKENSQPQSSNENAPLLVVNKMWLVLMCLDHCCHVTVSPQNLVVNFGHSVSPPDPVCSLLDVFPFWTSLNSSCTTTIICGFV